jgi:thiamine biosynthesis lipoprotein
MRALLLLLFLTVSACAPTAYTQTRDHMGTFVTITAYGAEPEVIDLAFDEISRIEAKFSEEDSMLARLNEQGYLRTTDEEFIQLLNRSKRYAEISRGAFDVTVKPVLDLYAYAFDELGRPPTDEEIDAALRRTGYYKITLTDDGAYLPSGTSITLGGIAKGYAIDRALTVLWENKVRAAIVNAGGDLRVMGDKPDGEPWIIALNNPDDRDDYITMFELEQAVATSGNYERYFDEDRDYHHIIDPDTGRSAATLISATVIAPTATQADALATSVYVLGPDEGMELCENLKGVECLLIDEGRKIYRSGGWIEKD